MTTDTAPTPDDVDDFYAHNEGVERITVTDPATDHEDDDRVIRFLLDDDDENVLTAKRPKQAVLLRLLQDAENPDFQVQAKVLDTLLTKILDTESAAYVNDRLMDDDDDFDLDPHVGRMVEHLLGRWYRRPTPRPTGSPRGPQRRGRTSTGR